MHSTWQDLPVAYWKLCYTEYLPSIWFAYAFVCIFFCRCTCWYVPKHLSINYLQNIMLKANVKKNTFSLWRVSIKWQTLESYCNIMKSGSSAVDDALSHTISNNLYIFSVQNVLLYIYSSAGRSKRKYGFLIRFSHVGWAMQHKNILSFTSGCMN